MNPQEYWMLPFNKLPVFLAKRLLSAFLDYEIGESFVRILSWPAYNFSFMSYLFLKFVRLY